MIDQLMIVEKQYHSIFCGIVKKTFWQTTAHTVVPNPIWPNRSDKDH